MHPELLARPPCHGSQQDIKIVQNSSHWVRNMGDWCFLETGEEISVLDLTATFLWGGVWAGRLGVGSATVRMAEDDWGAGGVRGRKTSERREWDFYLLVSVLGRTLGGGECRDGQKCNRSKLL